MLTDDEQFLKDLEKDFPNVDWDNLPDIETIPDIYIVEGMNWDVVKAGLAKEIKFSIDKEYKTKEEAEKQIEICKTWNGIIPESLTIKTQKPEEEVFKRFYADCLKRIKNGEKVFPIYLP